MAQRAEYEHLLAASYDAVSEVLRDPSGDVAFYVELARQLGGPVLELGCGTGRVLLPTAALGVECVGLDASEAMLALLRRKHPPEHLELIHGSMENFDLGAGRFRLITAPFRGLQHLLTVNAQLAALENVRRHLADGGVFAFDVFDPKIERLAVPALRERLAVRFTYRGKKMRRYDSASRDLDRQLLNVRFRFEGAARELEGATPIQLRWYYRYELEHLLARAGFTRVEFFGGFQQEAWKAEQDTVVLARAA